jgi:hypothetical protein
MPIEPGSTVIGVSNVGGPPVAGAESVTVTVWPAVSEPEAGEMDSSPAVSESVMLNVTGPPVAVSVNDPVYGPPSLAWVSRTVVADAVKVPGDGGGVGDADGEEDRLRDADGLGAALRPAAGVVAAG